ncbi:MAG: nitrilase-related carbon-nitrogen hydrolase [Phycisphaerales bacterium JB059]
MRAHLVQFAIVWEDPDKNFARVRDLLAHAPVERGDLVVLPEMFGVGFSLNVRQTAQTSAATADFLAATAVDLGAIVQGGIPRLEPGRSHGTNHMTAFAPDGALLCDYAKIHPFSYGREGEAFTGGETIALYDWPGADAPPVRVCPAVCYDLRFPELFRIGMLRGAELFALGANWPDTRQSHWRTLLLARAIENQAVVLGVNRTGPDPYLNYIGGSIAVGPRGEVLAELGDEEAVLSVEIDPSSVRSWRKTFPAWRDVRLITDDGAGA